MNATSALRRILIAGALAHSRRLLAGILLAASTLLAGGAVVAPQGGSAWKDNMNDPVVVPVHFFGTFNCWLEFQVSLQGVVARETNDLVSICNDVEVDPFFWTMATPQKDVMLTLYKPYALTLSGSQVYSANAELSPPNQHDIEVSRGQNIQRYHRYLLFILNPQNGQWEKLCYANAPSWNAENCEDNPLACQTGETCVPMSKTWWIQVRPDLGARPVKHPGETAIAGEEQSDDAWDRSEDVMDAETAPGDGDAVEMTGAKTADPASIHFKWGASLGRMRDGRTAGKLWVLDTGLATNTFTPAVCSYKPASADTNEATVLMDLDETNWVSQIKVPQALVSVDLLYPSALITSNDLIAVLALTQKLTNRTGVASDYLWTNFSAQAQQVLLNTNSAQAQLELTLRTEFNALLQRGTVLDTNCFAGVGLSGRARRLLLANPQGDALVRLNRFLLEDAYRAEVGRLRSTQFELDFYVSSLVGAVDSLGFFTLAQNASPFVCWRMGSSNGAGNQWRLDEVRNATTNTTVLEFAPTGSVWTLTRGSGADARIETRTISTNATQRIESQEVRNGAGAVSDRTAEVYQKFDWGYEMVAATNDPGGASLVTQFGYGTTSGAPDYQRMVFSAWPDGFWEKRVYADDQLESQNLVPSGMLWRIVNPWLDTGTNALVDDCLVTQYDYFGGFQGAGSYQLQRWHDAEDCNVDMTLLSPGAACTVYEEGTEFSLNDCVTADIITETHAFGDLQHYGEVVATSCYGESSPLAGHTYAKQDENGSIDAFDYEWGYWDAASRTFTTGPGAAGTNDLRQTIIHGVTDWLCGGADCDVLNTGESGNPIQQLAVSVGKATRDVKIFTGGNLIARERYVYARTPSPWACVDQVIYERDSLGHATNVFRVDPATQQMRVVYAADWRGGGSWPGDLKLSETDAAGSAQTYTYDTLKRLRSTTRLAASGQWPLTTTVSRDAAGRVLTNTVSGGSLAQTTVSSYDLAGRLTNQVSPQGLATAYSYQDGGRRTTVTHPSGTTEVVSRYLDRRVASVTGSAVTNQFFGYTLLSQGYEGEYTDPTYGLVPKNITKLTLGSTNGPRWSTTITDHRYKDIGEQSPAFRSTNYLWKRLVYNMGYGPGSLVYETRESNFEGEDGQPKPYWVTAFDYDYYGNRTMECRRIEELDYSHPLDGRGRTFTYDWRFETDALGHWFRVTEKLAYPVDYDATPVLVERTKERLTGFTGTQLSETLSFDADTNQTTVLVTVDLANKKLTTLTTVPQSSLTATQIVVNGLLQTESTPTAPLPSTHYFDALRREIGVRDPLGNVSGTRYDANTGQVTATTNALGLVTTMQYYPATGTNAGLLKSLVGPTGKTTYYNYDGCGRVTHIWGDVPYPEKRDYSECGDLVALTTFRGGTQWTGSSWPVNTGPTADVTQWDYDQTTGLLTNKTDAAGRSVKYDYCNNRYPKTRLWARGVASTNVYTLAGDLARIDYSDGTSVAFTNGTYAAYDRMARPRVAADASGTSQFTYDHAGRLVSTRGVDGLLAGVTVTNHFDPVRGRDLLQVSGLSTALAHQYGFDAYGRLSGVTNGAFGAAYAYAPGSDRLETTTCRSNGVAILTTTRSWEHGLRLGAIVNEAAGINLSSHRYQYDLLNRRTRAALEDGSLWLYAYNDRDELTGARRYWPDWTPVAGQQFGYDYDNLGNRESADSGGDSSGANLRTTSYTVNSLNQYTAISTPGYEDILGAALATNAVTVNGGAADRKGEYFHREIGVANGSGPVWQAVEVVSGGATNRGGLVFPDDNQALSYDLDGNLAFDGVWAYDWDGENRLRAMTMTNVSGIVASNRLRLEFVYDYLGRRVQKIVSTNSGGSVFVAQSTNRFVYDGWNLLAAVSPQLAPINSFLWGQDLSGTTDGAGGIGGLLAVCDQSTINNQPSTHFVAYDGNGNVVALVRGGTDPVAARYEYSPFGETLRMTGPLAKTNPFRFSTKFADDESGLVYYGLRYYSAALGRWISQDPKEDEGGLNLYALCANDAVGGFDPFGLSSGDLNEQGAVAALQDKLGSEGAAQAMNFYRRVKGMVDNFNDIQQFANGVLDASHGDFTDLFAAMQEAAKGALLGEDERHHALPLGRKNPARFQAFWKAAEINPEKFMVNIDIFLHNRVGRGGGGGKWNKAWDMFLRLRGDARAERIMGFAFSMLKNIGMESVPFL